MTTPPDPSFPLVRTAGVDGLLISFGDRLEEAANRAALAFRAAVEASAWADVRETATSLVSAYLRFDPLLADRAAIQGRVEVLLASRDWLSADLPAGRRRWQVPAAFGGRHGPDLTDIAARAGLPVDDAIVQLTAAALRVQTIGFAPGMPYLGILGENWDLPRRADLNARVEAGGLCVAVRQLVLFPVATPTGWHHVGQTRLRLFRPDAPRPFLLSPGDEVRFVPVRPEVLAGLGDDPEGGATSELIG